VLLHRSGVTELVRISVRVRLVYLRRVVDLVASVKGSWASAGPKGNGPFYPPASRRGCVHRATVSIFDGVAYLAPGVLTRAGLSSSSVVVFTVLDALGQFSLA